MNRTEIKKMKSNKQRRQEIKAQRLRRVVKKTRAVNSRPVDRPVGTVEVTPIRLRATTSYGIPDFVRRGYYQRSALPLQRLRSRRSLDGGATTLVV